MVDIPDTPLALCTAMRLILTSGRIQNTIMANEDGQVIYKTSTPLRLGKQTTTLYKVVPNTDPMDMQDRFEEIGKIEWHLLGSSIMWLHGKEMKTDEYIPRHGILGMKRTFKGPDDRPYRWDLESLIVVLSSNDKERQKLAWSSRRYYGVKGPGRDPALHVDPSLDHMSDTVVLTFIYVEKLRMDMMNDHSGQYDLICM